MSKYDKNYFIWTPYKPMKVKACDYNLSIGVTNNLKCFYWFNFDRFSLHEYKTGLIIGEYPTLTELKKKAHKDFEKQLKQSGYSFDEMISKLYDKLTINK